MKKNDLEELLDGSVIVLDDPDTVIQFKARNEFDIWHPNQRRLVEEYCRRTFDERRQYIADKIAKLSIGGDAVCTRSVQNIYSVEGSITEDGKRDFFLYTNDRQQSALVTTRINYNMKRLTTQVISSTAVAKLPWSKKIQLTSQLLEIQNQIYKLVLSRMVEKQDSLVAHINETSDFITTLCGLFAMQTHIHAWKHIFFENISETTLLITECMQLFYRNIDPGPDKALQLVSDDGLHDRILNFSDLTHVDTKFYRYKNISICILAANGQSNYGIYRISVQNAQIPNPTQEVRELSDAIFETNVFGYPDLYSLPATSYKTKEAFMNDLMHRRNTDGMILQCRRQTAFFRRYYQSGRIEFAQLIAKIRFRNNNTVAALRAREAGQSSPITGPEHVSCNIDHNPGPNTYYESMYDTFVFKLSNSKRFIVQVQIELNTCKVYMVAFNPFSIPASHLIDTILSEMVHKNHICTEFRQGVEEIINLLRGESGAVNFIKKYNFDNNHTNPPYYKKYLSDELLNNCITSSYAEIILLNTTGSIEQGIAEYTIDEETGSETDEPAPGARTVPLDPQYRIHKDEQTIGSPEYHELLQLHDDANTLYKKVQELEEDMNTQVQFLRFRSFPSIYKVITSDGKRFCLFQTILEWQEFDPMAHRPDSGIIRRISVVPI